ncbi:tRNA 2-thiouridine(34) synthase MnmA [Phycicoccus endophyticus]|uniref:tRNA-specific 2-thiouridylase MnmA n=1 Tax=Phycicoccus endophyticus TaxID=1690220 RepID=A0A7G9QYG0_9MICO|nr:tRNA 2-thiouridine(34) synthase MnmA [Phycicoccus endophyticus]NHI19282.1 tRNA 2-thiouridine(34) synthase MnmA [Phycicoccus endophyticus]QNN48385.1 tRNA 2-thiouridine(34) synthase MnmA [Phycicoccus endophyticus]GGL41498.1 tRNA-specific 2-thiouridylase MnmA [Phycicoccus endophyticus]
MRVVAAMSGGVDSAVAAARMLDAGHDVVGVHLALSRSAATLRESARGCCTLEDAGDARRVADRLGIPFYVWDLAERFERDVVEDFVQEYAAGRTPNPCLRCNERIKFAALLDKALALGFDGVATGHYARVLEGPSGRELHRAVDPDKDQSYVLGVLDADQLARAFFPLGGSLKAAVRQEAAERGFAVARKPDSHDICFVADGDTRGFLTRRLGERPGELVDAVSGKVVGEHAGVHGFTVGQRRGLGLERSRLDGEPRYVVGVDAPRARVLVGTADLLGVDVLEGAHLRWCGPPPWGEVVLGAQVRAHGEEVPASATVAEEVVRVRLGRRVRGVAPGQSVVLYEGSRVVGSATVTATSRAA